MRKIVGAILIMISGMLFASFRILSEKEKLKNLKEMQKALFFMKQEIAFSGKILTRIMTEIASRTEGEVKALFIRLGEELIKDEKIPIYEAFFRAKSEKAFLSNEAAIALEDFFKSVGTFSGELEEEHLDAVLEKLSRIEIEERERFYRNKKLTLTLGICASFSVVMLLL